MAALKDVRLRIKAVGGIRQITKAMKMVATVKMKRVQDTLVSVRPYTDSVYEMAVRLASSADDGSASNPYLRAGSAGPEAVLVIGSDRGLCGSFNNNLFRFVDAHYGASSKTAYILVGKKARDYYKRRGKEITKIYEKLVFPFKWEEAETISRDMLSVFSFGGFSRVSIAYQQFISAGRVKPKIVAWLPFRAETGKGGGASGVSCEPTAAQVLDAVLPRALAAQLYRAVLESQASEQSARMMAMENATNNASDLIRNLTLLANRLRQTGITKELLEITSGSEALKA